MALIPEIDYTPGQDSMEDVFDKINQAIQTINAVLGGMDENQGIRKVSGDDFDFEAFETGGLNWTVVPIGAWNMQSDDTKTASHFGYIDDASKIVFYRANIRNDSGALMYSIEVAGGILSDNSNGRFDLNITPSGMFDSSQYSSTGISRGNIIVACTK